jgi:hypothetical protein
VDSPLATTLVQDAAAPAPSLRPLGVGEILDRALQLFRANFLRLFTLMIAFQAPSYAAAKAFQALMQQQAPAFARPGAFRGELPSLDQVLWLAGAVAVLLAVTLVLYQLALAALTAAATRAFLGERIDPWAALRLALRRSPQVLGTFLAVLLWSFFLLGLASLPGAGLIALATLARSPAARVALALGGLGLAGLAWVVLGLWLFLKYALVSEVVIIEELSLVRAMRRSARLMAGSVGRTFFDNCKVRASVIHAVNLAITVSVAVVTSLPALLVNSAFGVSPLNPETYDPARVPLWALLPAEVFQVFSQTAIVPFGLLAVIVFYFDLRIRKEGFDLELLAARVGRPP